MLLPRKLPPFITTGWYSDHATSRCPHDAWLESLEISEPAEGERNERRQTAITLKLLGSYHDGYIVLRYTGVTRYHVACASSGRGMGDWLYDKMTISDGGILVHTITWSGFGPNRESQWQIEAVDVSYEWIKA